MTIPHFVFYIPIVLSGLLLLGCVSCVVGFTRMLAARRKYLAHEHQMLRAEPGPATLDIEKPNLNPKVFSLVETFEGGIHKRIDEVREITEVLLTRAPHLYRQEPALVHWLKSTDAYLRALRDTVIPVGINSYHDRQRLRLDKHSANDPIYDQIRIQHLFDTAMGSPASQDLAGQRELHAVIADRLDRVLGSLKLLRTELGEIGEVGSAGQARSHLLRAESAAQMAEDLLGLIPSGIKVPQAMALPVNGAAQSALSGRV